MAAVLTSWAGGPASCSSALDDKGGHRDRLHPPGGLMKTAVITKMSSTNMGNEALSRELITLMDDKLGKGAYHIHGRPGGLIAHTLAELRTHDDPVAVFERRAYRIASVCCRAFAPRAKSAREFRLLGVEAHRVEGRRRIVKRVRMALLKRMLFSPTYIPRAKVHAQTDRLLYSGAGEVMDTDILLRQLLDLRVA